MSNRYVLVVETEQAGVDGVYAQPDGSGYTWPDVNEVQATLRHQAESGARVTIVKLRELAAPPRARVVCPECGQSTWRKDFGCALPGCENHACLVGKAPTVEGVQPPVSSLWSVQAGDGS